MQPPDYHDEIESAKASSVAVFVNDNFANSSQCRFIKNITGHDSAT